MKLVAYEDSYKVPPQGPAHTVQHGCQQQASWVVSWCVLVCPALFFLRGSVWGFGSPQSSCHVCTNGPYLTLCPLLLVLSCQCCPVLAASRQLGVQAELPEGCFCW
jgi:hypothetical protein